MFKWLKRTEPTQSRIVLVSGATGAGKSTTVAALVSAAMQKYSLAANKIAVVINDADPSGISPDAVSFKRLPVALKDIPFGCVCCSSSGALETTLRPLIRDGIQLIIVECAGTSDPYATEISLRSALKDEKGFGNIVNLYHLKAPKAFLGRAQRGVEGTITDAGIEGTRGAHHRLVVTHAADQVVRSAMHERVSSLRGRAADVMLDVPLTTEHLLGNASLSQLLDLKMPLPGNDTLAPGTTTSARSLEPWRLVLELREMLSREQFFDIVLAAHKAHPLERVKGFVVLDGRLCHVNLNDKGLVDVKTMSQGVSEVSLAAGDAPTPHLLLRSHAGIIDPERFLSIGLPIFKPEYLEPKHFYYLSTYLVRELRSVLNAWIKAEDSSQIDERFGSFASSYQDKLTRSVMSLGRQLLARLHVSASIHNRDDVVLHDRFSLAWTTIDLIGYFGKYEGKHWSDTILDSPASDTASEKLVNSLLALQPYTVFFQTGEELHKRKAPNAWHKEVNLDTKETQILLEQAYIEAKAEKVLSDAQLLDMMASMFSLMRRAGNASKLLQGEPDDKKLVKVICCSE